jgi:hypothetical protein
MGRPSRAGRRCERGAGPAAGQVRLPEPCQATGRRATGTLASTPQLRLLSTVVAMAYQPGCELASFGSAESTFNAIQVPNFKKLVARKCEPVTKVKKSSNDRQQPGKKSPSPWDLWSQCSRRSVFPGRTAPPNANCQQQVLTHRLAGLVTSLALLPGTLGSTAIPGTSTAGK